MKKVRLLSIVFLVVSSGLGREINFSANVDRTTVGLGEPFQLTVTVQGINISRVPRPRLPSLEGFDNLGSSQSQSTSISIINGRMQQEATISFVYTLVPKKTGELTIGPCQLEYNNMLYTTEPITITVVKSAGRTQPKPQARARSPFDILEEPAAEGDFMLILSVDKKTVYQGEQITATWTFYTNQQVTGLNLKDPPSLTGFWSDEVYQPKQLEYEQRNLKGKSYYAAVIKKVALFPTQSGGLKIGAMSVEGEVMVPGFFFSGSRPFTVSSEPVIITVKPLPDAGRPPSYTGGVGSFQVSASLSKNTSTGGEPITLTIGVSGSGNLSLIGPPSVSEVPGLKILKPEIRDNLNYTAGKLSGTRRFSYPLLPAADGRYRIPEIELGFFDPGTGAYYTKKTQALEFVASNVPSFTGPVELQQPGLKVLGTDIRHIKLTLGKEPAAIPVRLLEMSLYPLSLLILVAGVLFGRHRKRMKMVPGFARRTRALGLARKRLNQAERLLKENRRADFYQLVRQALIGYAGDRYNIESGALTSEELRLKLAAQGVDSALIEELLTLAHGCELARFSPGAVECEPRTLLMQARQLIGRL
ncbi:MAG: BatD family protein [bacterium]